MAHYPRPNLEHNALFYKTREKQVYSSYNRRLKKYHNIKSSPTTAHLYKEHTTKIVEYRVMQGLRPKQQQKVEHLAFVLCLRKSGLTNKSRSRNDWKQVHRRSDVIVDTSQNESNGHDEADDRTKAKLKPYSGRTWKETKIS